MKAGLALAACIALVLPNTAPAAPATPAVPVLTPESLGGILSIVEFCEDISPHQHGRLREMAEQFMRGLSEERIETMKRTADFKSAYVTTTGVLRGIPKYEVVKICTASSE